MDIVYIETSIVSHATAWPSSDSATAVLQNQAKRWMQEQAVGYQLVTSQVVLAEAARGDPDAAARRFTMLADILMWVPVPGPSLIMLLIVNAKATRFLQQYGIKVGLLGANYKSI